MGIEERIEEWLIRVEARIIETLERLDMSAQSDVDAATAAITSATTTLNTAEPEIAGLLGAGVDTSALDAAIAPLREAVAGIAALAAPGVTTHTATVVTTSSTGAVTTSHPVTTTTATATTAAPPAAAPARTVGTGLPGDPVRPAPGA
jgi:hypothetical protein